MSDDPCAYAPEQQQWTAEKLQGSIFRDLGHQSWSETFAKAKDWILDKKNTLSVHVICKPK
jgi:hypothetical protein